MKKAILLILVFTLIDLNTKAQTWAWAKNIPVQDNSDIGLAICSDDSGNVIVAGSFQSSSITFGSHTLTNSSGYNNIFVVKYSTAGSVLWATAGGSVNNEGGYDEGQGISTDMAGNVLVTGCFSSSSIIFGNDTLTNAGSWDVFVVKYSPAGNVSWATSAGGTKEDRGGGISTDIDSNVLLTGFFTSPSIIFGNDTLTNDGAGASDMFVVKYSPAGSVLWAINLGGEYELSQAVSTDDSGNVLAAGGFSSDSITFGNYTLINDSAGTLNGFIVKYDSAGNVLWAAKPVGLGSNAIGSISTDADGNVLATGGSSIDSAFTKSKIFIAKYSAAGNVLCQTVEGGSTGIATGWGICTDANGNALLAGIFANDTIIFGNDTLMNADSTWDFFIAKGTICTTTGIDELSAQKDNMSVYPNPSSGIITISLNREIKNGDLSIYNLLGEKSYAVSFNGKQETVNCALPAGIYFLQLKTENESVVEKFVKE